MATLLRSDESRALRLPMAGWDRHTSRKASYELHDLQSGLAGLCVHVARAAGYFGARSHGRDHRQAVKASNATAARVRRALGYTIPRDDINF